MRVGVVSTRSAARVKGSRPVHGTIGMMLSGGDARGACEFGALEVLAPVLDEPARVIVGTSAGALGAAYLSANAHDGLEAGARSGADAQAQRRPGCS
jgi:predicted acylesterase/phospholipase RssA